MVLFNNNSSYNLICCSCCCYCMLIYDINYYSTTMGLYFGTRVFMMVQPMR